MYMEPNDMREKIQPEFDTLLKEEQIISEIKDNDAYGHKAGDHIEDWLIEILGKNEWEVYPTHIFLEKVFSKIGKDGKKILESLKDVWWGKILPTKKQITAFVNGEKARKHQQAWADFVLVTDDKFFDDFKDLNKIILVNAKSHESSRDSRDPNIMSAQRLLQFLHTITKLPDYQEIIGDVNYWFIGVVYSATDKGGIIESISIKDLFKLDVSKIPQINFDAAIQIQWHVENMVEKEQTKIEFIKNLSESFLEQWKKHSERKTKKYNALVKEIGEQLKEIQAKIKTEPN